MKKTFNTFILILVCIMGYAQNNHGALTIQDLSEGRNELHEMNYLIRNHVGDIIDVRNGETISNEPYSGIMKQLSDGSIVYKGRSNSSVYLQFYTDDFTKDKKLEFRGQLSPNWEYLISAVDGDLHRSNLDLDSKSFGIPTQVTTLGIFTGSWIEYLYWHKDKIVIKGPDRAYTIDTKTLEIDYVPENLSIYRRSDNISPTGRFVVMSTTDIKSAVYDIETNTIANYVKDWKSRSVAMYWNDYNTFSLFSKPGYNKKAILRTQTTGSDNHADLLLYSWEGRERPPVFIPTTNMVWDSPRTSMATYHRARIFSNHSVIYTAHTPAKLLYKDLTTGELTLLAEPDDMWDITYPGFNKDHGNMIWADSDQLLFTRSNDLLKQGTFVFSLSTKESRKISNYVADDFFKLPLTNYGVFVANRVLYSYHAETGEVLEIGESIDSRLVHGDDQVTIITRAYSLE